MRNGNQRTQLLPHSFIGFKHFILTLACLLGSATLASGATPVLIVMGGYQSCPPTTEFVTSPFSAQVSQMSEKVTSLKQSLQDAYRKKPQTIFTCYTGILKGMTIDRFELWMSHDPNFTVRSEITLYSSLIHDSSTLLPLYRDLRTRFEQIDEPEVFLVGHSYGGWTASHVAQHFGKDFEMVGLTTLDAIHPGQCKPLELIGRVLSFRVPKGCRQFPSDIDAQTLKEKLQWWQNFYQNSYPVLHSGPVSELESRPFTERHFFQNILIKQFSADAHSAVARHPLPWLRAQALMRN